MQIEPEWYIPILPMVLVNGSSGIGTGWSSDIPNYNPMDPVENLRHKLNDEPLEPIHPWFRGFKGEFNIKGPGKYRVLRVWDQLDPDTLDVTELPIRVQNLAHKKQVEAWITTNDKALALVKKWFIN
ncbi:hypothetical protein CROQUDRAFT_46335 [Cronartium quercuum f. sp. fusiforme G11]|uniref:DNA topoisomerase (ATP-hydrolyzing) n=1 Tax=Cronartium quercuum f. sp. fusiforme G11 TaxID=708437 RepID=A0A9P6NE43_9BASI|nr:hypothetical protein CROQUDRAFT_46335 [Cronartium quercuum f. sp. fusiforme G11]